MRNLFLRLYLLLIVAFLGFGWSVEQLIDSYEADETITSDIDIHRGSLFLINKELGRLMVEQQDEYISAISNSFGYPIGLVTLDSLTGDSSTGDSSTVDSSTVDSSTVDSSTTDPLAMSESQLAHLTSGGVVVSYDDEQGISHFYQQLNNSQKIIALGPIHYQARSNPLWSILLFVFIALAVFIWLWPITKGLTELTRAASAFGRGEFTARAKVSATSPLITLVERFNAMAKRIARLVESHKELSHGVSHELRTPIARLRFAMEMVREVDNTQQRHKYLDTMDTNIEELDGLVDELLVYAKFDREEPQLQLEYCDLVQTLTPQLARFTQTEPQLQINFYYDQSITVQIDKAAICRAVDNLVRNGVRYAKTQINVSLVLIDQRVRILVDDDGPGIPEQSREELFKPFVRLDESRDRKSGGIGLGLAIVKRLVALHQGTISVTRAECGGARFIIDMPIHQHENRQEK